MKIHFTQSAEDLYAFQKFFFAHSLRRLLKPLHMKLLLGAVTLILGLAFVRELISFASDLIAVDWGSSYLVVQVFTNHIIIFIVAFIVFLLYRNLATKRLIDRSIRNNPDMLGDREIEFLDGKVMVSTPQSYTEYEASAFTDWASTAENEFLMLGKNKTLFIPRSAFDELQHGEYLTWRDTFLSKN